MTTAGSPQRVRTVIAAPLYNKADYLESALDSLLAQTDPDFALILVDDGSEDATPDIGRRYVDRDPRVSYWRNETRLGVVDNWRRCLRLARELHPEARYYAWASDHDLWDPRWLEALAGEMDRHPEVVLAYPRTERITDEGQVARVRGGSESVGVTDIAERIRRSTSVHAGDTCYGLMRIDAVERVACFRPLLEPDRLMMAELAVHGQFRHVPDVVWQRRFMDGATRPRQRRQLFAGRAPLHTWLPPWMVRPPVFLWLYAVQGIGRPEVSRLRGLRLSLTYALASFRQILDHWLDVAHRRWRPIRKRVARTAKRIRRSPRYVRIGLGWVYWGIAERLGHRRPEPGEAPAAEADPQPEPADARERVRARG